MKGGLHKDLWVGSRHTHPLQGPRCLAVLLFSWRLPDGVGRLAMQKSLPATRKPQLGLMDLRHLFGGVMQRRNAKGTREVTHWACPCGGVLGQMGAWRGRGRTHAQGTLPPRTVPGVMSRVRAANVAAAMARRELSNVSSSLGHVPSTLGRGATIPRGGQIFQRSCTLLPQADSPTPLDGAVNQQFPTIPPSIADPPSCVSPHPTPQAAFHRDLGTAGRWRKEYSILPLDNLVWIQPCEFSHMHSTSHFYLSSESCALLTRKRKWNHWKHIFAYSLALLRTRAHTYQISIKLY
uniref:Uncharacterized protein n=1 Tax=Sphaerodactylus townsendi TaxID=933632 RepID=A0ACB8G0V5_9SAUR